MRVFDNFWQTYFSTDPPTDPPADPPAKDDKKPDEKPPASPAGPSETDIAAMVAKAVSEAMAKANSKADKSGELDRADKLREEAEGERDKTGKELEAERRRRAALEREVADGKRLSKLQEVFGVDAPERALREWVLPDIRKSVRANLEAEARKVGGNVTDEAVEAALDERLKEEAEEWAKKEDNAGLIGQTRRATDRPTRYTPPGARGQESEETTEMARLRKAENNPELPRSLRRNARSLRQWCERARQEQAAH